jgi:short-chain fatty acids transporter
MAVAPIDRTRAARPAGPGTTPETGALARLGVRFTNWAERWFPDAFIFVAIAVVIVALGALANGASAPAVAKSFGDGFWSLIPFTMQMAFVTIGGYVVAVSPPVQALIERMAQIPRTGRGAVGFVAGATMISSFLS